MKAISHFFSVMATFLFCTVFVACNGLQTISDPEVEEMEQIALENVKALMSSDILTDTSFLNKDSMITSLMAMSNLSLSEYEEAMDWWKDREGALPAVYEYDVSFRNFPSGHGPDTCIYYATITWNCYPPISEGNWTDYQYMQVQYRPGYMSGVSDPWYYLGEGGPGVYNYGIVKVNGFQDPLDLNATHLPTSVQLRYRLLHKSFPGKADKSLYDKEQWYDKNLATAWYYKYYNQRTYNNPYGYDVKDLEELESLKFIISAPMDCGTSFQSISVNIDGYVVYPKLVGGRYEVTVPKFRKRGVYLVTAEYATRPGDELKIAHSQGIYEEYTGKEVYILLDCNSF